MSLGDRLDDKQREQREEDQEILRALFDPEYLERSGRPADFGRRVLSEVEFNLLTQLRQGMEATPLPHDGEADLSQLVLHHLYESVSGPSSILLRAAGSLNSFLVIRANPGRQPAEYHRFAPKAESQLTAMSLGLQLLWARQKTDEYRRWAKAVRRDDPLANVGDSQIEAALFYDVMDHPLTAKETELWYAPVRGLNPQRAGILAVVQESGLSHYLYSYLTDGTIRRDNLGTALAERDFAAFALYYEMFGDKEQPGGVSALISSMLEIGSRLHDGPARRYLLRGNSVLH